MASIGLKDFSTFFAVPVHADDQRILTFNFDNLFQFTCMPNEYGSAMGMFTKISKIPFLHLRNVGHNSVIYVDDSFLQRDT